MSAAPVSTGNHSVHCAKSSPAGAISHKTPAAASGASLRRLVVHVSGPVLAVPLIVSRPITPAAALALAEQTARRFYGSRFVRVSAAA